MICEQWDVVSVPFPFIDRPAVKRRPALVISSRTFNDSNEHSLLAMITTALLDTWPSDTPLVDFTAAGLKFHCYVRWKVFTLPNDAIVKKIGALCEIDRRGIASQLELIFGGRQ